MWLIVSGDLNDKVGCLAEVGVMGESGMGGVNNNKRRLFNMCVQ